MRVIPYEFRKARFQSDLIIGYWVRLYLIFDGVATYTFFHLSELLENASLCRELGIYAYTFDKEILVTDSTFPQIFKTIQDYVQDSSLD